MTLTSAALKDALLNAKLPQIRVAIPAIRCKAKSKATAEASPQRDELEKLFRDDFAQLSRARTKPRSNPKRLARFSARDMTCAIRQAAA